MEIMPKALDHLYNVHKNIDFQLHKRQLNTLKYVIISLYPNYPDEAKRGCIPNKTTSLSSKHSFPTTVHVNHLHRYHPLDPKNRKMDHNSLAITQCSNK